MYQVKRFLARYEVKSRYQVKTLLYITGNVTVLLERGLTRWKNHTYEDSAVHSTETQRLSYPDIRPRAAELDKRQRQVAIDAALHQTRSISTLVEN